MTFVKENGESNYKNNLTLYTKHNILSIDKGGKLC